MPWFVTVEYLRNMIATVPTIMAIGGSDPTGGAGIQADLKTITILGGYGAAVITAITAQNSHGVEHIELLSPLLISRQLEAVRADHLITHIKIGMIGSGIIAKSVAEQLSDFNGEIVYDPVMVATTGQSLLRNNALEMIKKYLLPVVTVLTPNIPELFCLTGKTMKINNGERAGIKIAGQELLRQYQNLRCIIVKGGHGPVKNNLLSDVCLLKNMTSEITISHKYIHSANTHGTGCTLASAFAVYHSKTSDYRQSFINSVSFVQRLISRSTNRTIILNPTGKGPMLHAGGT